MSGLIKKLEDKVDDRMKPLEKEMKNLGVKLDKIIEILEDKLK
jgi:hypothetical protein